VTTGNIDFEVEAIVLKVAWCLLLQRTRKGSNAANTKDCGALDASFRKSPEGDVGVSAENAVTA